MHYHDRQYCPPAPDDVFGPVVATCARSSDFTLLFEQSVLSLPVNGVLLLLVPWRAWSLYTSSPKVRRSWMSIAKSAASLVLVITQVLLLAQYATGNSVRTSCSIPATVLSLAAAVAIGPLSLLEQQRSVRPSTLINSYLAASMLLSLPEARTLYLIPGQMNLAARFSAVLVAKALLLSLESLSKRPMLEECFHDLAKESTSGIWSRSLFLWMNSLFKRGYTKIISFDDLGPIDHHLGSTQLHQRLEKAWMRQSPQAKFLLLRSLWTALRWSVLSPIPPRLCYAGFLFAQPFLIKRATSYVSFPSQTLGDKVGYGLIIATACIYLGIAVSNVLFKHQLYRHITMVRGSLASLIYSQTLALEDKLSSPSAAVTLMSSDVDRICQSLVLLHDLWARPLELAVGVTLLAMQIGWVCVVPLAVVFFSAVADSRVTATVGQKVRIWTDAVQHRISLTAEVLSSMGSVKILGLTQSLSALLQKSRLHELGLQARFRWSTVWLNTLGNVPPAITPAATFITYAVKAHVTGSGRLNISEVFTSLALITLITTPASELLAAVPFVASCLGCLQRIEEYLLGPGHCERRLFPVAAQNVGVPDEKKTQASGEPNDIAVHFYQVNVLVYGGSDTLLRNVDLELRHTTLTIVLGPSGSGKSTLLRTILGEAKFNGTILINANRLAYCPQHSWLFTGTIRQNVCGLEEDGFDETWYKSVLYACALDEVLLALPHGDSTHIMGQNSSLSGGQRQRLILARALYPRPQLLLLDDVLSALDVKTEVQVMTRLFGNGGLVSRLQATVMLVTHANRWEAIADSIVTLNDTGNVTQRFKTPSLDADYFSSDRQLPELDPPPTETIVSPGPVDQSDQGNSSPNSSSLRDRDATDYAYYFRSVQWPLVLMLFGFATAQTLCYYMSQVVLKWWAADHDANEATWLPTYIILATGNAVLYGCTAWTMFLKLVPESASNLHKTLLDVVMNAPYSFFTKTDAGTIVNRFSQDMTLIESQLPTGILCTLIYVLWTGGSLALISTGSVWMALTLPSVFLVLYWVQRVYLRTSRRLRTIELELRSPTYTHFMETLNGLSSIRTFKWESQFTNAMIEKLDASQVPYYLLYCAQRWLQLVLDLIVTALAIVVMTLAVELRSSSAAGSLGLSLSNILSFNEVLSVLLQFWTQLEVSIGAITRTRTFSLETPSEPQHTVQVSLPECWPERGEITIRNLCIQHTNQQIALDNITMIIRPGEKIGVCGRSGSGKSSLISAVLRLIEPVNGSILIDNVDLAFVPHKIVRERILAVSQSSFLVQQTVRFNMDPQGNISDEVIITALSQVSLWPIMEKKGGLDATVTTDLLSQGQKQLFSLARAILRKKVRSSCSGDQSLGGVLLLDEATSNLDVATDTLVQDVIREEFSAYTVIVVAHRLDTILDSDRIAVLDKGRLVEFDDPQMLLSRNSMFSSLYAHREDEVT